MALGKADVRLAVLVEKVVGLEEFFHRRILAGPERGLEPREPENAVVPPLDQSQTPTLVQHVEVVIDLRLKVAEGLETEGVERADIHPAERHGLAWRSHTLNVPPNAELHLLGGLLREGE